MTEAVDTKRNTPREDYFYWLGMRDAFKEAGATAAASAYAVVAGNAWRQVLDDGNK